MSEESPFNLPQSLPLCCLLAAVGGLLEVAATACTAIPAVKNVANPKDESSEKTQKWWWKYLALTFNVTLQLVGSITSHLIATWFGPVSMVVPFFYSSTLLCNMLIFGSLLGLEFFTQTAKTGTLVIVVTVVLLPVVGPSVQEGQQIEALLRPWYARLWAILLLTIMFCTGILIALVDISQRFSQRDITLILLSTRATSIAVNLTVSKGFVSDLSPTLFPIFLVLKILSGAIYTYAIVVQSTAIQKQSQFLPLNTTTIITINAITGILIWEDYKVMASWYGYACVFCLLGLACELLLDTEVSLLTEDNPDFGVHKRASLVALTETTQKRRSTMVSLDSERQSLLPTDTDSSPPDQPLSRQEAWKHVLGVHRATSVARSRIQATYNAATDSASQATQAATQAARVVSDTGERILQGATQATTAVAGMGNKIVQATGRYYPSSR